MNPSLHSSLRQFLVALAFVVWLPVTAFAQETELTGDDLLWETPLWGHSLNLRAGGGYKDNLLLSNINKDQSYSLTAGLDYTLYRMPLDGTQFYFLITGDFTSFPEGRSVDDEQLVMTAAQLKKKFLGNWQASLDTQYAYQNQVYDASITEADVQTLQVRGHRIEVRPGLRRNFSKGLWTEVSFAGQRQMFAVEESDDYWEAGPRLVLGLDYGRKSEVSVSYSPRLRYYDTRAQFDEEGFSLPGTSLEYALHTVEAALRHHFDEKRRWRATTKLVYERVNDNGQGFFDYARYQAGQQLRYRGDLWEVRGSFKWNHYLYDVQTASFTNLSRRSRTTYIAGLRIERALGRAVRIFVEYEYEQVLSNQPLDRYRVNTVQTGLDWAVF